MEKNSWKTSSILALNWKFLIHNSLLSPTEGLLFPAEGFLSQTDWLKWLTACNIQCAGLLIEGEECQVHGAGTGDWYPERREGVSGHYADEGILTVCCREHPHQGRLGYTSLESECCGKHQFSHFWKKCRASTLYWHLWGSGNEFVLKIVRSVLKCTSIAIM